ncbi:hypothetical protein [Dictyobacter arantiisoli]|uniref:hypothetical protein n=1 Tax=Dictyobacter arantiisoli TaxID=2014874 RepID=UPI00155B0FDB|nr:hypothetical protein [Dictyobacter arantiisoli]
MATLHKTQGRGLSEIKLKPVHPAQFALYFILVVLCILITAVSILLITTHI